MGTRRLGFAQYDVHFLFEDEDSYREFGELLLHDIKATITRAEQAYIHRGIEVVQTDGPMELMEDDE